MTTLWQILTQFGRLFQWWLVLAPWEQALRVRLGKHVTLLEAGIHLKIPVIDRIFRQTIRRRFSAVPPQTLMTNDGQPLTIAGSLGYVIKDMQALYNTLHHAEATVESEAQGLIADYVINRDLRDIVPSEMQTYLDDNLDLSHYGLGDTQFIITTFISVRTYRLLQGEPRDWTSGDSLNVRLAEGETNGDY